MNLADRLDVNKLFGKKGMSSFLPYIAKKVEQGKPFEKILMLDLLRHADFDDKDILFKNALLQGGLEIRMKIIDMAFEGSISFNVIKESCGELAKDTKAIQYLIFNLFSNYKISCPSGVIEGLAAVKAAIDKGKLNLLQCLMFEYLYESNKEAYQHILEHLSYSQRSGDLRVLLKIMDNFIGIEDEVNRSMLVSIMMNLKGYQGILIDTAGICSVYDHDMGMMYLKEVFTGYCQQDVVARVCSSYGATAVINNLKGSDMLIPKVYILHAATQQTPENLDDYLDIYQEVKVKLKELVIEKLKIQGTLHQTRILLSEEVESLINSVSAALLEFLFAYYRVPMVAHLEKHLSSADGKKMIFEIVRNSLPLKVSDEILPILEGRLEFTENQFVYSTLMVGGMHHILANIYMVLGQESMESQFAQEIETVSILKKTSVFENLDIESLYEILRIGEFISYGRGEEVVNKGETGDKLYVVIQGEAGIYLAENEEYIATIGCGEMFGEEDVIEQSVRISTVKTLNDSLFFRINGGEFVSLAKTNNELAFSLLKVLAGKLRNDMKVN